MNLDWMNKLLHLSLDEVKLLCTMLEIVFKIALILVDRVSAKRTRNLVDQDFLDSSYKTQFPLSGNVLDFSQNSLKKGAIGESKFQILQGKATGNYHFRVQ